MKLVCKLFVLLALVVCLSLSVFADGDQHAGKSCGQNGQPVCSVAPLNENETETGIAPLFQSTVQPVIDVASDFTTWLHLF